MSKTILLAANIESPPSLDHQVVKIDSVVGAYRKILADPPDVVVLGDRLLDGHAFDILTFLRNANRCVPAILVSDSAPNVPLTTDRLSYVHESISSSELSELINKKLEMKSLGSYTLDEYLTFARKSCLSIEIAVCHGEREDCSTILLKDGKVIDAKFGRLQGADAYVELLKIRNVDIRFRKPEDEERQEKMDEEWHKMFFSENAIQSGGPTPVHGTPGVKEHSMKHTADSHVRKTFGHGTTGVPFFNKGLFYESEQEFERISTAEKQKIAELEAALRAEPDAPDSLPPFPAAKSDPIGDEVIVSESAKTDPVENKATKTEPLGLVLDNRTEKEVQAVESIIEILTQPIAIIKPPIDIKGLGIGQLLDIATDEMLSRRYDIAHYVLKAAVKMDPDNTTALANLDRLETLLKENA